MSRHPIRLFCLTLALVLILGAWSVQASTLSAAEMTQTVSLSADHLADSDTLFAGYVEQTFLQAPASGSAARAMLSSQEQLLYDFLKAQIQLAADGQLTSSVFSVDEATFRAWETQGIQRTWTNADFGTDSISDVSLVYERFFAQFDLVKVMEALVHDCPYSLYWFDKDAGISYTYNSTGIKAGGKYTSYTMSTLSFLFRVSGSYQAGSNETINTALTGAAKAAAANAQAIANRYSGKSDYEKLAGFRDQICKLVSYDAAADSGAYGDPWQVIYVFDGDSSTNVVCEGYAKAFQYLCDLSTFDAAVCRSVHGSLTASANKAAHMWNIVTMEDGKNYLVDITNSDAGTAGADGSLFLTGGPGSISGGYTLTPTSGSPILYRYSENTKTLWGTGSDSILSLAGGKYHHWEYSRNAAGDTISAVCTAPECPDPDGGSITLSVPDTIIYDGAVKTVSLSGSLRTGVTPEIVYDCAGGCTEAGHHSASVTVAGLTISADFVIEPTPKGTSLVNPSATDKQVTFGVRSDRVTDAVLVVAYYRNGAMVFADMSETTTANASHTFSAPAKTWDTCKVFLLEKGTFAPLCQNLSFNRS